MPTDRRMDKGDVVIYIWWNTAAAATAKSLQSCPTLCDPIDGSPPGSPVPGILQARILEWVAISFCNVWKWKVKVKSLSRVRLLETPWTTVYQAPPSMGFSRQEYWSGVPLLLSHKKEWSKAICSNVYEPRGFHTKWSQSVNIIWCHLHVEYKIMIQMIL